ncbi:DedA family protein [Georgenia deserti]|uniref:DedA family protein n=1 Tax=Georgenia deserti TaxID=2093781 RepID=A0ABW4L0T1_9MICO
MDFMAAVEDAVLTLGASPWLLVAVFLLSAIDGFFPPVPSESVVIAAAVLSVAGNGPSLWLLVPAAAVGAFLGDLIAYSIGTKIPVETMRLFRGRRGRAALEYAKRMLARRGSVFILSGRFIPVGRVAVNMTAGAVGYPRSRFAAIDALAAVVWAGYSTLMGLGAGHVLHEHPVIAVVVGVVGGVTVGLGVDKLLGLVHRRFFPDVPPPEERMHVADSPDDGPAGPSGDGADGGDGSGPPGGTGATASGAGAGHGGDPEPDDAGRPAHGPGQASSRSPVTAGEP